MVQLLFNRVDISSTVVSNRLERGSPVRHTLLIHYLLDFADLLVEFCEIHSDVLALPINNFQKPSLESVQPSFQHVLASQSHAVFEVFKVVFYSEIDGARHNMSGSTHLA